MRRSCHRHSVRKRLGMGTATVDEERLDTNMDRLARHMEARNPPWHHVMPDSWLGPVPAVHQNRVHV